MEPLDGKRLRLQCQRLVDRAALSVAAFRFTRQLGFDQRACWEICIAVQELASNMIRHAGGGALELFSGGRFVDVIATDSGPGIPEAAARGSADSRRGLGAVHRLMHELEIASVPSGGARVRARRYMDRTR